MLTSTPSRECLVCKVVFYKKPENSWADWERKHKTCSRSCSRKLVGNSWLRKYDFKPGVQSGTPFKKGAIPHNYKGDDASYTAKHIWVAYHYGKASKCEFCGVKDRKYHWSNISGEYKRDRNDWQQLCIPCHKKFDLKEKL